MTFNFTWRDTSLPGIFVQLELSVGQMKVLTLLYDGDQKEWLISHKLPVKFDSKRYGHWRDAMKAAEETVRDYLYQLADQPIRVETAVEFDWAET